MNKQVEQIKTEIKRWKKELRLSTSCEAKYRREMLDDLSEFIDSLPKEPIEEDLEKEFNRFLDEIEGTPRMYHSEERIEWGKDIAHHFAEWQKEQMMKDAIPARVSFGQVVLQERPISTSVAKDGDKVKIIIVKKN